jgi:hypothetical protein
MEKDSTASVSNDALTPKQSTPKTADKVNYIDNLKILCTILVILHHAAITYGAPGGWYYQQKTTQVAALFPMTVFVSTDQSFFMGFFFFLSALFVESSYQKKGAAKFTLDRLKRLGIPLVFYSLVISPILNYMVSYYGHGNHYSFLDYIKGYDDWIDFGVMWFVAALLLFNLIYVLIKQIPALNFNIRANIPYGWQLIFVGILLGLFTFCIRLTFHVGWTLKPLGFQLGHFPQYILMFIAGIIASKNKWLNQLDLHKGKISAYIASFLVVIILPAMFVFFIFILKVPGDTFLGGWNSTAITYSLFEQITGLLIMSALLSIAKFKWNFGSPFWRWASANAFGVYVLHPFALIGLALMVKSVNVDPAFKFFFVGPMAVVLMFPLIYILRKIPGVNRII